MTCEKKPSCENCGVSEKGTVTVTCKYLPWAEGSISGSSDFSQRLAAICRHYKEPELSEFKKAREAYRAIMLEFDTDATENAVGLRGYYAGWQDRGKGDEDILKDSGYKIGGGGILDTIRKLDAKEGQQ